MVHMQRYIVYITVYLNTFQENCNMYGYKTVTVFMFCLYSYYISPNFLLRQHTLFEVLKFNVAKIASVFPKQSLYFLHRMKIQM